MVIQIAEIIQIAVSVVLCYHPGCRRRVFLESAVGTAGGESARTERRGCRIRRSASVAGANFCTGLCVMVTTTEMEMYGLLVFLYNRRYLGSSLDPFFSVLYAVLLCSCLSAAIDALYVRCHPHEVYRYTKPGGRTPSPFCQIG